MEMVEMAGERRKRVMKAFIVVGAILAISSNREAVSLWIQTVGL